MNPPTTDAPQPDGEAADPTGGADVAGGADPAVAPPAPRASRRPLLIGGAAVLAAAAGLIVAGAVVLERGAARKPPPTVGFSPSAQDGAAAAAQTGAAFLAAWQRGDLAAAAAITDNPGAALAALTAFRENLGVAALVFTPAAADGTGRMPFSAAVQAGTPVGRWSYRSALTAYPKRIDGYSRWFVRWAPQLPFASLKAGDTLKIKKIPARVAGAADRNGRPIDPAAHPGLSALVGTLTSKPAPPSHDGQDVVVVAANGTEVATVGTLTEPVAGFVTATTLDLTVQSAAEAAVTFRANSSMVAIQPSTGHILAFANNTTSQYYDDALLARVAPGSTFKIITSTMLLANNLVTLDATAPCPTTLDVDGLVLHNSEGDGGTDSTYAVDFAQSCNNAFSTFYDAHGMTPDLLADTAKKYFGLNQSWDIGLGETAQYMTVPSGLNGAALAESLVGQGDVVSCPLAMCSVAATVAAGEFRQPILMPGAAQPPVTALGTELQAQLKTLMASVVAPGGTAAAVGFPGNGHFFAKTGTAEVGSGANLSNNSWFVVFDDRHDIALGALSVDGGYGAAAAGAECLTAMRRLGYA